MSFCKSLKRKVKKAWALLDKKYLDLHFSRVDGGMRQVEWVSCCLSACLRQLRDSQRQAVYEQCDMRASSAEILLSCVGSWAKCIMEMMQEAKQNRIMVQIFSWLLLFHFFVLQSLKVSSALKVEGTRWSLLAAGIPTSPSTSFLLISTGLAKSSCSSTRNSLAVLASTSLSGDFCSLFSE